MASSEHNMRQTLEAVLEAFNAHDIGRIMDFFVDDCVLEMPRGPDAWGTRYEGKHAVRMALSGRFAGIPDVHYGNAEHFTCNNTGISKWTITGTTAADGTPIEVNGCDFYSVRGVKISKKNSFWKIRA